MSTLANSILGIAFLFSAFAATFLMYHLWGYPFDYEKLKSSAPPRLMRLHRALGWIYAVIYIVLICQMVPRLWQYQVEFPARTVAHLLLGISIGTILLIKIVIVRFFKHLEGTLAPIFGTTLLIFTVLLLGLSVPFSLRTIYLERNSPGGSAFSAENLDRVAMLIPEAGFPNDAPKEQLGSVHGLRYGQQVVMTTCIQCHDLRTILARPRTPEDWVATVNRMGDRATVTQPILPREQWFAAAYLIAISPQLQKAVLHKTHEQRVETSRKATISVDLLLTPGNFDANEARKLFELNCVKCHSLDTVKDDPPQTNRQAAELVVRMVNNGLSLPQAELQGITFHLSQTFVKP